MRYLKGTVDFGVYYDGSHEYRLYGYMDADWVGSVSDGKSTSGGCYSLGSAMISWFSRKQSSVALSTTEAEYIVACSASCESIWLRKLISGSMKVNPFEYLYGRKCSDPISWDNTSFRVALGPKLLKEMTEQMIKIK